MILNRRPLRLDLKPDDGELRSLGRRRLHPAGPGGSDALPDEGVGAAGGSGEAGKVGTMRNTEFVGSRSIGYSRSLWSHRIYVALIGSSWFFWSHDPKAALTTDFHCTVYHWLHVIDERASLLYFLQYILCFAT